MSAQAPVPEAAAVAMEVQDQRLAGLRRFPPRDEPFAVWGLEDQILKAGKACLGRSGAPVGGWVEQAALVHEQHGKGAGIQSEHSEGEKAETADHGTSAVPCHVPASELRHRHTALDRRALSDLLQPAV